ncbi:MAG: hypothetical protein U0T84_13395 [Chitinophagales bacterium]
MRYPTYALCLLLLCTGCKKQSEAELLYGKWQLTRGSFLYIDSTAQWRTDTALTVWHSRETAMDFYYQQWTFAETYSHSQQVPRRTETDAHCEVFMTLQPSGQARNEVYLEKTEEREFENHQLVAMKAIHLPAEQTIEQKRWTVANNQLCLEGGWPALFPTTVTDFNITALSANRLLLSAETTSLQRSYPFEPYARCTSQRLKIKMEFRKE